MSLQNGNPGWLSSLLGLGGRSSAPRGPGALIEAVRAQVFRHEAEYRHICPRNGETPVVRMNDYIFATTSDPHSPQEVFPRLRWGGQFVFVSPDAEVVARVAAKFSGRRGFILEHEPGPIPVSRWRFFGRRQTGHYFSARKIDLIQPGQSTDRFTYRVYLAPHPNRPGEWAVCKEIPDLDRVIGRLHEKFPDATVDTIAKNARKLVDKVFPVFLTREAAFLGLLQRDLPEGYRHRVPRLIRVEKDSRGFVSRMYMEWLRNGGEPMSQIDFARQSADLLNVLHDEARIMHLDLRLDNFVITPRGVGFIDFGSAVRMDENLAESPMLGKLFDEMMTTSQIQRDLGRMKETGRVTSRMFCDSHQKVDKAVDLFYVAMQMNNPHLNPEFIDLVRFDPASPIAQRLMTLTREILQPTDTENPPYRTAIDILHGIERIEAEVQNGVQAASEPSPGRGRADAA